MECEARILAMARQRTVKESMTIRNNIFLLLLCFLASITAGAATPACKDTDYGKCFQFHGRYNIYADGDAIWIVGTKRRPETTDDHLDEMLEKAGWEGHSIFGDFTVCPESIYERGHRQTVCIQSYKNIRLAKWNSN